MKIMGSPHGYGYIPMEPVTIMALGGLALGAASTGHSIYSSQKQAEKAEDASDAQSNEQARLRGELEEKQRQEEASTAAKEARTRQRLVGSQLGRKSSVLTSPMGLPDIGGYGGGTYLGGGRKAG